MIYFSPCKASSILWAWLPPHFRSTAIKLSTTLPSLHWLCYKNFKTDDLRSNQCNAIPSEKTSERKANRSIGKSKRGIETNIFIANGMCLGVRSPSMSAHQFKSGIAPGFRRNEKSFYELMLAVYFCDPLSPVGIALNRLYGTFHIHYYTRSETLQYARGDPLETAFPTSDRGCGAQWTQN